MTETLETLNLNGQKVLMNNSEYRSAYIILTDIVKEDKYFNVPIYQRLYVWKQAQVNTLLEDIYNAFETKEQKYFLGGIMTAPNREADRTFDLIDGQQRFTTLWLTCNTLRCLLADNAPDILTDFCKKSGRERICFSIRPKVSEFISTLGLDSTLHDDIPDLRNLIDAAGHIRSFLELDDRKNSLRDFAEYLLTNVVLIETRIPDDADLNKIFELINGRGQQLSQTDILKSRILKTVRRDIDDNEDMLIRYGQLWDSCSDMSGYIESNIYHQDPRLTWKDLLKAKNGGGESDLDFDDRFLEQFINERVHNEVNDITRSEDLLEIIKNYRPECAENNRPDKYGETVRSIASFPMLLLYTLRIFLVSDKINIYGCGDRCDINIFNEKKLLHIFSPFINWLENNQNKKASVKFLHLLWKVRYAFDRHVVKFVSTEHSREPVLAIKKLRIYENSGQGTLSVTRDLSENINDMSQLQSMLYFSQPRIYEHWICPFIYKALTEDDPGTLLKYLQELDNNLLCQRHEDDMIIRTYTVMSEGLKPGNAEDYYNCFHERICESKGCGFAHYLFYKMEYILWKTREDDRNQRWKEYRINSKNSIEHISPQTPKFDEEKISNCDDFGNLALISSQDNSSYNNKSYKEKRASYLDKRSHGFIDSLKSDMIYQYNDCWGEERCQEHFTKMKEAAKEYFKKTTEEYADIQSPDNQQIPVKYQEMVTI
ncbi:MAG: DUF262 domain-containing protein [Bacteroidales bacterium]|nr:DUF262 domain-containing protein [Bacteroidales bacterium]